MVKDIKKCKICKIILTSDNSYYPSQTNLLCKKHHYKAHTIYRKNYSKTNKGKNAINKTSRKAYLNHKEKWLARAKARYAISKGIIFKPKRCEVCERVKPLQAHHEDYSKPLEVIFLCYSCHAEADKLLESKQK